MSMAASNTSMEMTPENIERANRIKNQLEYRRAEARAESEQLQKLVICLSESELQERRAQKQAARHREMRDFHQEREAKAKQDIRKLREELALLESPPRRQHDAPPGQLQAAWGRADEGRQPPRETAPRDGGPMPNSASAPSIGGGAASSSAPLEPPEPRGNGRSPGKHGSTPKPKPIPLTITSGAKRRASEPVVTLNEWFDQAEQERKDRLSVMSPTKRLTIFSDGTEETARDQRTAVRTALIKKAGGPLEAFKAINMNGSGNISLLEFSDGVNRMGVNWQEITGMKRPQDVFRLFDQDKDGVIVLNELFPAEIYFNTPPEPPTTPEFWKKYCKDTHGQFNKERHPQWSTGDPEGELSILFAAQRTSGEVADKRKWMQATIRRLKGRGKSDARCREVVALHLPRGTGPKDREDVNTFSDMEVKGCKREYSDQVFDPVRNIQKVVYELREQRHTLQKSRQKLYAVAMEPHVRKKQEEERKNIANTLMVGGLGGASLLGKVKNIDDPMNAPTTPVVAAAVQQEEQASFSQLAEAYAMDVYQIEDIFVAWMKLSDKADRLGKKGFAKLLKVLVPNRTLGESDVSAWWAQVVQTKQMKFQQNTPDVDPTSSGELPVGAGGAAAAATGGGGRCSSGGWGGNNGSDIESPARFSRQQSRWEKPVELSKPPGRAQATFDQFIGWYHSSEIRVAAP